MTRSSGELTGSECSECGVVVVVGLQVVWRTLRAVMRGTYEKEDYRMARYCKTCAKKNGEFEQ